MDDLYQRAKTDKRKIDLSALRKTYVQVLVDSVVYYDKMANDVIGRSPKHVILLHENDLAAMFVGDFVKELRKRGWKVISPSDAYKDEIAKYSIERALRFNPGRIGEMAKDKNWPSNLLWHEACDEAFLENLFVKNQVYQR